MPECLLLLAFDRFEITMREGFQVVNENVRQMSQYYSKCQKRTCERNSARKQNKGILQGVFRAYLTSCERREKLQEERQGTHNTRDAYCNIWIFTWTSK